MKKILCIAICLVSYIGLSQNTFQLNLEDKTATTVNKNEVTSELQSRLYDLIAHYHSVQQAHWNVKGPQFQSLHNLTAAFYEDLGLGIDKIAERKLALGVAADGRPSAVSSNSTLGLNVEGLQNDYDVVSTLTTSTKTLSDNLSASIKMVGEYDIVSQDVLIGIKDNVDSYLWKLRSYSY